MSDSRISRRAFVIGGTAAAIGAAGAAAFLFGRSRAPSKLDWGSSGSAAGSPGGAAGPHYPVQGTFRSRFVADPVGYAIAAPPIPAGSPPLPVVFCLPGRGGTASGQVNTNLPGILASQVANGSVRPFGLAFIDGGESYWHKRTSGEDRMRMLVDEFVPMVQKRFSLGGAGKRGIMGWSMGGFGALLAAEQHPGLFSAVAAASPAIWPTYDAMMNGPGDAFDSAADFARNDVFTGVDSLAKTPVLIDCGEQDPFFSYVREFVATFPAANRLKTTYAPGGHEGAYWASLDSQQIDFFAKAFRST